MTTQLNAKTYYELVTKVLEAELPFAGLFLEEAEPRIVPSLAKGQDIRRLFKESTPGDRGAGVGDISTIADVLSILTVGWTGVAWLRSKMPGDIKVDLEEWLFAQLRSEGLEEALARRLASNLSVALKDAKDVVRP